MPMVPTQRRHSSTIHIAAVPDAMKPVTMAGDAMNPSEKEKPVIEFARPRIRSSARLLSREPMVGEKKVSPRPNRALKARTHATLAAGRGGGAASPNTAQEAAPITPINATATLLRRPPAGRNTRRSAATKKTGLHGSRSPQNRVE